MGASPDAVTDRVWTLPNVLSMLRVAGVPLFLYLLLGPHADGWALVVLMLSGFTDWADGKLARVLNQSSRLGSLLDPVADRLYMVVIPISFAVRGFIPWWVVAVLLVRELLLAGTLPLYRSRGLGPPEVHYLGKAATFTLMIALPMVLLAQLDSSVAHAFSPWAGALLTWGVALYVWTAVMYLVQAAQMVRALPRVADAR
ncbi:CDP-alcohol phosphatidyltransferase family protein [Rhodococcus sp. D2-41]|uniref:CDP-alcohol phosphatidyltransferase family protein n=1 Tax=Speluncibacter jeojiensis TaxID=2710754 RepID=A0A9X4M3Y4_9ACTN|nr:CDP-alcohol phosphatidyltransferase family protein [Rhodococcus sp. D2-41]MDG3012859.1 CDP-alcohol phosphatidyltransferase family protein [Rhodococcus sp. D2-41]MDG3016706.1 CDP-alcohol phosphatidyltransferase family protein [Corynebacteriales bacterium D3-21]